LSFAKTFLTDPDDLVEMTWFGTRSTSLIYLTNWVRQGEIVRAAIQIVRGKKRDYARWFFGPHGVGQKGIFHDRAVTSFGKLYFWDAEFVSGGKVNRKRMPDLEMIVRYGLETLYADVELDADSEVESVWKERLKGYQGSDRNLFIVVCAKNADRDKKRLNQIMQWSGAVLPFAWFALLSDVKTNRYGDVWWHAVWSGKQWEWEKDCFDDPYPEDLSGLKNGREDSPG
jgi:hypothetical protein